MKIFSVTSNVSFVSFLTSLQHAFSAQQRPTKKRTGFCFALLLSALVAGCASKQTVDDLEELVASYNAEVERNKVEQVEILTELQRLESEGESESKKAVKLREQLELLEEEQERQEKVLADFEAVVLSNQEEIEKLKRHETGRNAAVERLSQSLEEISSDTNRKIRDIESQEPVAEEE